uniref:TonB-dependent transporter Oar-like beta-barrel domain-containing protein n=1 Tax=Solibacter usitatus (strain Ellin6076) TaxID=234267 RepID=Q020V2_SOLUE
MFRTRILVVFLAALFAVTGLNAQVAGRLSGSIVDQTGAAIPGATVNLFIPGGKEPVVSGSANETGLFSFIAIRPDTYDIVVESKGFNKAVVRSVKVAPIQETGLPPIKLEVQSATTSVEVAADVQSVQLTNAEVSSTITSQQVQNLPVLGRQVSTLFQTQAGVTSGSNTTSVNGLRSSFSNVTLDGINIQDNFIRTNDLDYAPMRTTIDQIAEITVSTSNGSTAMGGGASQMVLSTRSGSNTFHGSAYWYNRNSALSANDWFNNQAGVNRNRVDLNQVGAALGGRIIRDKLFFYTNYEVYRNKTQTSTLRTVLTDAARNGNITYRDAAGNTFTKALSSIRNYTADPTIKAMIASLPAGNTSAAGDGLNTTGYRFNAQGNENRDQFVYKGDYYLNAKNSFTGTYNHISNPTLRPDTGAFYTTTPPVSNTIKDNLLSLSWRWTATPTLTNEVRGGFMRADTAFLDSNQYPTSIVSGLLFSSPVNTFLNQGRKVNTYSIQDNATWLKGKHELSFGFQSQLLSVSPFNDASILPTYTLGISGAFTNSLTAADLPGIRSSDLTAANNLYANLAGIISSAAQTFNVTSTTSGFVPGATNLRQLSYSTYAGYIQDKWKLRPNLTVNIGMRYEYWTPMDEKNSLYLAPRLENNDAKATVLDPNAVLDFIGKSSGRPMYNADKNNFAPNIGFAWDPFKQGKTSIRGGYMIAYVNDNLVTTVRNNVGTSSGLSSAASQNNLTAFLASAPAIPTPVYKVPRTLADNYALSKTSATGMPAPGLVTPYVQQWNFGIQQEVKGGAIVAARYIGNRGTNLLRVIDYNQININANGFLADFLRAQNNAALAQKSGLGYVGTYNANVAGSVPLTVFPLLGGGGNLTNATYQNYLLQGQVGELANQYMTAGTNGSVNFYPNPNVQGANVVTNGGESIYHAVQFEVTKRTRAGLQGQFSYTFGKSLSNTAGDSQTGLEPNLDNNNPQLEWARSPYDVRHAFKANYYYELPFGKGMKWSGNKVTNAVLGNWAVSGIWSYQAGAPYSVLSTYGTLNRAARSTATNTASVNGTTLGQLAPLMEGLYMTGSGPYFVSPSVIGSDGRGAAQAGTSPFSGQLFYNPTAGNVGNLQRRLFTGPWQWSWDMSVKKTFHIKERHSVALGADLINWMNHPTFYVPPSTGGDYGSTTNFNINSATFGKITSMNYNPRVIQLSLYYRF